MLAADSTIAGRYRLVSLIGEGGMASVWRAQDETLKRAVAIKLLYFRAQRDPQATVDQFLREARLAACVQHRNVIHIVDFGTTETGVPYMVMELLHGQSLADRMRASALSPAQVVVIANLTLRGLSAVHEAGIVHRDLKPQNIFLQADADSMYPKILDFGISRSLQSSDGRASAIATQQGLVVGTPHYMAPEQARGDAEIDKRADIYSMGAIIFEGITGQLPFDAPTPGALLVKILSNHAPRMRDVRPDVPELLSDCVAQAMAYDREHRFLDAKVFRRALQAAAEKVFGADARRGSELPVAANLFAPSRGGARRAPAATVSAPAWGDFEGVLAGSERGSRAQVAADVHASLDAANQPRTGRRSRVSDPTPDAAAGGTGSSQVRARVAAAPQPPTTAGEQPLFGDNPLDPFTADLDGPVSLDIDYERGTSRASRGSPLPKVDRPHAFRTSVQSAVRGRSGRRRCRALFVLPAALLLVLLSVLLAPRWFSAPAPDEAALRAREAQRSATRNSSHRLSRTRPPDLGSVPVELRELQF